MSCKPMITYIKRGTYCIRGNYWVPALRMRDVTHPKRRQLLTLLYEVHPRGNKLKTRTLLASEHSLAVTCCYR